MRGIQTCSSDLLVYLELEDRKHTRVCMCLRAHTHVCARACACACACVRACVRVCVCVCIFVCAHLELDRNFSREDESQVQKASRHAMHHVKLLPQPAHHVPQTKSTGVQVHMSVCTCVCVCVRARACARECMCVCVYVSVCVCVRARRHRACSSLLTASPLTNLS